MNTPTITASGSHTATGLIFQPDAAEFCDKHNLHALVELAAQLAAKHYTLAGPIEVELETDPDSDEQRPILNISVSGSVDNVGKQYRAYVFEWVGQIHGDAALSVGTALNLLGCSDEPA